MIGSWPMNIEEKPNFSLKENMLSFVPIFFNFDSMRCSWYGYHLFNKK